jgi:predicted GNAT family N-acyltransferase
MLEVRRAVTPADREAAYAIRHAVFVGEQGVSPDIERDDLDQLAEHVLALVDGRPVGAGRLVVRGPRAVVGRMAVLREARGTGVGARLLDLLESTARSRGCAEVELHAQVSARGFYERLGYTARGDVYQEAGIDHVDMRKPLASAGRGGGG